MITPVVSHVHVLGRGFQIPSIFFDNPVYQMQAQQTLCYQFPRFVSATNEQISIKFLIIYLYCKVIGTFHSSPYWSCTIQILLHLTLKSDLTALKPYLKKLKQPMQYTSYKTDTNTEQFTIHYSY